MQEKNVQPVDILIVGAGLTGLTAAYTLDQQAPARKVHILEARDRVGGRILTVTQGAGQHGFDLGPTWVWPGHNHLLGLLKRLGISLFPQFEEGDAIFDRGVDAPPQRFHPAQGGGESWRLVGGVGTLTDRLLAQLPADLLRCQRHVEQIEEKAEGLLVSARSPAGVESYLAQQVVVTLPPRLVADTLAFVPALPADLMDAMRATQTWMGQAMKALLVYDRPFWRAQGLSGLAVSYGGPVAQFHDASPADGTAGALFGWLGNHCHGRSLPPTERQQAIVQQAVRLFGADAAELHAYVDLNWAAERFTTSLSAAQAAEVEHPRYGHPLLQQPQMHGRLHWAGTETSTVNGGYLDGAVYSGERIARRLIASYS